MALLHEEDDNSYEDERSTKAQRADTHRNLKRHIPLVSLQLWQSLVAMCCNVKPLAFRMLLGR